MTKLPWLLPCALWGAGAGYAVMMPRAAAAQEGAPPAPSVAPSSTGAAVPAAVPPPAVALQTEVSAEVSAEKNIPVVVEFASDRPMTLWRRRPGASERDWSAICKSPCVSVLDPKTTLQVRGDADVPHSRDFALPRQSNHYAVEGKAGNLFKRRLGLGLLITGVPLSAVGLGLLAYGGASGAMAGRGGAGAAPSASGVLVGGGVLLGAGISLLIAGVALAVTNTTRLQLTELPPTLWPGRPLARRLHLTPSGLLF